MRDFVRLLIAAAIAALPASAAAQAANANSALMTRLGANYYSLKRLGFGGARCRVTPDWTVVLGQPRSNPQFQTAFTLLDQLQFVLAIDSEAGIKLDKKDTGTGHTAQQTASIQQIFAGLDQELGGFFSTWSLFMIQPPTPAPSQADLVVAPQPGGYRLSYKDGHSEVRMETNRAGEISHLAVSAVRFISAIDPTFVHDPAGLVLTHYVADYLPASGPGKAHLVVDISYQTVGGLKTPDVIRISTIYDGTTANSAVTLSECQVTRSLPSH